MTHIAILDDYQDVALGMAEWSRLPPGCRTVPFAAPFAGIDDCAGALADFDVIVAMRERTPFPRALLERLPKLRLLVTTGMRNGAIDLAAAKALGITVCGTEGLSYPTAELAWGLILSLLRRIPDEQRALREGRWQTTLGTGLNGKTLGVLGLGTLGSRVARVGKAFGMEVLAWSQNLTAERARAADATLVDRDELLRRSDVVSIHLVLGERTRGLVAERELRLMKPTAYLVNTSRAPIVDEAALVDALHRRAIAGAGLDVYGREPLPPDHPLLGAPNTVLTPHLGYVTEETYRVFYGQALEDIEGFLNARPLRVLQG